MPTKVEELFNSANPLDIKVGGYTPPAPVSDPIIADIIKRTQEKNIAWTPEGTQAQAQAFVPVAPKRIGDLVSSGFRSNNTVANAYDWMNRRMNDVYDPKFQMRDHQDLLVDIPADLLHKFADVESLQGAEELRSSILKHMQDAQDLGQHGILGTGAALLGGLVDLPSLLPAIGPMRTAKAVGAALKVGNLAEGVAAGLGVGALVEPSLAVTNPTGSWADVPAGILHAGLFGGTMAGLHGALSKIRPGLTIENVADAHMAGIEADAAANQALLHEEAALGPHYAETVTSTANKAQAKIAKDLVEHSHEPLPPEVTENYAGHEVFGSKDGTLSDRSAAYAAGLKTKTYFTGMAQRFKDAFDSSSFATDFDRLANSGSDTARVLAYSLFESPEGVMRNDVSGAMLKHLLTNKGFNQFHPEVDMAFTRWAADNGHSFVDTRLRDKAMREFSREVQLAVNDINFGRRTVADIHPELKNTLDALHKYTEYIRTQAQGPHESLAVPGFENIKETGAYYIHQRWGGPDVRAKIHELGNGDFKAGKDRLGTAIGKMYELSNPGMRAEDAQIYGKALVNRMMQKGTGIDTNLQSIMQGDGRLLAKEMLVANGVSKDHVDAFLDRLTGVREDAGKVGAARRRTPIDLNLEVDGVKAIDLINPDFMDTMHRYNESMTNRIALSRYGIKSRDQIEHIKNTILNEIMQTGENKSGVDRKFLDYVFSYFQEGPIGEGVHPIVRRLKALTDLALLNKVNLAQLGETGGIVQAVGVENFAAASQTVLKFFNGDEKISAEVVRDLGFMTGNLGYERNLIRANVLDEARAADMSSTGQIGAMMDDVGARLRNVQSTITGYFRIMEEQTRIAALAITNRIFTDLRDGKDLSKRLYDMGLEKHTPGLQRLIADGVVEFNQHGNLDKLNIDKWTPQMQEAYGAAVTRFAYQVVQRGVAGESMQFMHDSSLALFTHLKSYPLLAIKKQMVRAIGNEEVTMLSLYGFGTAATVAAIGYAIDGQTDKLNPTDISRRAFNMANVTGWIPEFYDPIAGMTGLPQISSGGGRSTSSGIPMVDTVHRMMQLPKAIANAGQTKEDVRAFKTIPIIGNYVGMSRIWGANLQDSPDQAQ